MPQFHYTHENTGRLEAFPYILEIGYQKNTSIQLQSFPEKTARGICIYFINEGKFEWEINRRPCILYPGDVAIIMPGQKYGNEKCALELGSLCWISISLDEVKGEVWVPGAWSCMSGQEAMAIGKLLCLNDKPVLAQLPEAGRIISSIAREVQQCELAYLARVRHLTDELLILITRQLSRQQHPARDFPKMFMKLEEELRKDLSHQWTVEEMAAIAGMGTTLFNERVKNYTGFTPINYLINIRISAATKLLKKPEVRITDIALDTGFYSSQHFSTTFKKLTGYTPKEFRKNNSSTD